MRTARSANAYKEQHHTVPQLAKLWAMDDETIIRAIEEDDRIMTEAGDENFDILKLGGEESKHKRSYYTRYVSDSAAKRIYERLCQRRRRPQAVQREKKTAADAG